MQSSAHLVISATPDARSRGVPSRPNSCLCSCFVLKNADDYQKHLISSPTLLRALIYKNVRFVFQTIALLNIYRNPQNNAQSADGLRSKLSPPHVHWTLAG